MTPSIKIPKTELTSFVNRAVGGFAAPALLDQDQATKLRNTKEASPALSPLLAVAKVKKDIYLQAKQKEFHGNFGTSETAKLIAQSEVFRILAESRTFGFGNQITRDLVALSPFYAEIMDKESMAALSLVIMYGATFMPLGPNIEPQSMMFSVMDFLGFTIRGLSCLLAYRYCFANAEMTTLQDGLERANQKTPSREQGKLHLENLYRYADYFLPANVKDFDLMRLLWGVYTDSVIHSLADIDTQQIITPNQRVMMYQKISENDPQLIKRLKEGFKNKKFTPSSEADALANFVLNLQEFQTVNEKSAQEVLIKMKALKDLVKSAGALHYIFHTMYKNTYKFTGSEKNFEAQGNAFKRDIRVLEIKLKALQRSLKQALRQNHLTSDVCEFYKEILRII